MFHMKKWQNDLLHIIKWWHSWLAALTVQIITICQELLFHDHMLSPALLSITDIWYIPAPHQWTNNHVLVHETMAGSDNISTNKQWCVITIHHNKYYPSLQNIKKQYLSLNLWKIVKMNSRANILAFQSNMQRPKVKVTIDM